MHPNGCSDWPQMVPAHLAFTSSPSLLNLQSRVVASWVPQELTLRLSECTWCFFKKCLVMPVPSCGGEEKGREGSQSGRVDGGKRWIVMQSQWQPWLMPQGGLEWEWLFRAVTGWAMMARPLCSHINRLFGGSPGHIEMPCVHVPANSPHLPVHTWMRKPQNVSSPSQSDCNSKRQDLAEPTHLPELWQKLIKNGQLFYATESRWFVTQL